MVFSSLLAMTLILVSVHFYKDLSPPLSLCTLLTVSSGDTDRLHFMEEMKHFEVP